MNFFALKEILGLDLSSSMTSLFMCDIINEFINFFSAHHKRNLQVEIALGQTKTLVFKDVENCKYTLLNCQLQNAFLANSKVK